MRCRMRSIASGVGSCANRRNINTTMHTAGGDTSTPVITVPAQRSPGTFYASDRLRRWMFTQMPNSNSSASSLRQPGAVAEPVASPVRHLLDSPPPAVATVEFPAYQPPASAVRFAPPALVAGILILQRNGFQHRFRIFRTVQRNQRFCQQQANLPVLIRQLQASSAMAGIGVIAFLHQLHRLLRFQLFFARQHFIQQGADRLFRLQPLEAVYRLPVLEQIHGRESRADQTGRQSSAPRRSPASPE